MESNINDSFEVIFNSSSDAILLLHDNKITTYNPSALKLFSLSGTQDLIGTSPFDFSPEFQPNGERSSVMARNFVNEALSMGNARFEWLHKFNDTELWAEYSLDRIGPDKNVLLAIIRDIGIFKNRQITTENRISRLIGHNQALSELSILENDPEFKLSNFKWKLLEITVSCLEADHVAIWWKKGHKLKKDLSISEEKSAYKLGNALKLEEYPRIKKALFEHQQIVINDSFKDPRSNELKANVKPGFGSGSMLFVPIISGSDLLGLLWIEISREIRKWEYEEQFFAASIGEMLAKQVNMAQKKKSEKALLEKEEYYRTLIEKTLEVTVVRDKNGVIKYVSPSVDLVFDIHEADLIGQKEFAKTHPDDIEHFRKDWKYLIENPERSIRLDQRIILPNGKVRYIEGMARNLLKVKPVNGMVMNFRDVTSRKKAESALIESQMRLEGIISSALDAIITVDSNQNIVLFNDAAEKMFLQNAFDVFGKPMELLLPTGHREKHNAHMNKFRDSSIEKKKMGSPDEQLYGLRSDGTLFPIDASISKQVIEDEVFFTAVIRDITEQLKSEQVLKEYNKTLEKEVESRTRLLNRKNNELNKTLEELRNTQEQLVESEKMASLGQLTAGIAHEINNPINFVTSTISPLKRDIEELRKFFENDNGMQGKPVKNNSSESKFLFKEIAQLLEGIEEGAKRTKNIVLGLRNFSRLDEESFKKTDLHDGLDNTLMLLNSKLKGKIDINKKYGKIPLVECLPGKINQVFMNILSNAIQAIENKGKISIITRLENKMVKVKITDTGHGMTKEVQKRIFEPFFTTKDVGIGTGLGLSISYGIIEKHGGTIEVESEHEKGTTFVISLPVSQI